MYETKIFNFIDRPNTNDKKEFIDFLYEHLENYRDPKAYIEKAISYAIKEIPSFGGFVLVSYSNGKISGIVVVNQTGMRDYIPENILVYIATHKDHRGKGIGKQLMRKTIELAKGSIALHVEPNNPAIFLYKKFGFTGKYLDMRLIK